MVNAIQSVPLAPSDHVPPAFLMVKVNHAFMAFLNDNANDNA